MRADSTRLKLTSSERQNRKKITIIYVTKQMPAANDSQDRPAHPSVSEEAGEIVVTGAMIEAVVSFLDSSGYLWIGADEILARDLLNIALSQLQVPPTATKVLEQSGQI